MTNGDGYIHLPPLTMDEVRAACYHGVQRRIKKLNGERQDRAQGKRSTWDNEMEGACAELAFAKYYGVFWGGLSGLRAADCLGFEIRWTNHFDRGGLLIYRNDQDDRRFVLVDGFAPEYRIIGELQGREGKLAQWLHPDGYYMVPRGEIWEFSPTVVPPRV